MFATKSQPKLQFKPLKEEKLHDNHQSQLISACIDYVVEDLQPFTAIEGTCFYKIADELIKIGSFYKNVKAQNILPKRRTLANKLEDEEKKCRVILQQMLQGIVGEKYPALSFTTDMWSDKHKCRSWVGVTVHWVNDNFELNYCTLSCIEFEALFDKISEQDPFDNTEEKKYDDDNNNNNNNQNEDDDIKKPVRILLLR